MGRLQRQNNQKQEVIGRSIRLLSLIQKDRRENEKFQKIHR